MPKSPYLDLSRRERQIMDVVYRLGRAGVAEVREGMPDPPSYSAVRAMVGKLETKGFLTHEEEGPRYVYMPTMPREEARETALQRMVRTFFDGSVAKAAAAMLDLDAAELTEADLDELAARIEDARKRGR
ncbi:MAG: BlaI/MecI/CopY family transcriptional regulator [Gemmatimonadetes bacterium]|nr:BlaI/MecI/CopY family transcriptional regulator [Gemmatimonadota bacterium]